MNTDKGGRPQHNLEYATLDGLCAIQCTGEEIAAIFNIDYDTLNRALKRDGHTGFADYYKKKSANGKMSLRRKQFEVAKSGNPTMLVWLGKQWLEQSDKKESIELQSIEKSLKDLADKLPL